MDVVAAVFARGGSQGILDKNLQEIGGRSLVARAVADALACSGIERVIASTDDPRIAEAAEAAGADVPWLRPAELATSEAREWDAWQHLLRWLDDRGELPDRLLVVPATAPLRRVADLERCLAAAAQPGVDVVLTVSPAHRNPWFNMVTLDDVGRARLVNEPPARIHRRQDAPAVYDVGTVAFVADPAYVLRATSLYDGEVRAVEVDPSTAIDIDTPFDLDLARAMHDLREDRS
ncbi:cytidylyltransferase domain-containing protein [Aquihabitans daechungensis]|uniref:acylneuraminate cytidylyltransferase family protein n=1 Tax=Aquihabitans daechungensis TaxID=1052257 RepID=UPI003BA239ED